MASYTIGIDFGTLSGRAVLVDTSNGNILASSSHAYAHGVMDRQLPDGTMLPNDWALQHPQDYLDVLDHVIPALLNSTSVHPSSILAIGIDFTSSTTLPVDQNGTPLCFLEPYRHNPHAYAKLWKHHGAQPEATRMLEVAEQQQEDWLEFYGGKISAEWSLPKLWQLLKEAPEIYDAMDSWMEAGDWIVRILTGKHHQSACSAGYKSFYRKEQKFPHKHYFSSLDEKFANVLEEKLSAPVLPVCSPVGTLTPEMAKHFGLSPETVVAVSMIDAHACVPAAGLTQSGDMLAIIGTSACYMALGRQFHPVPGISGAVEDGILPGYWGYEAGQSCVGDLLAWFTDHHVPEDYQNAARKQGRSIHEYLTSLAQMQQPGQHGLLALDWWNGNRSILMDSDLTGLIIGLTLHSKPEDIYRALMEATAFGAKTIIETFVSHGIDVQTLYVTGGICHKNPFMMQLYADILNMPIHVVSAAEGGALGSAIIAATACGCYETAEQAISAMSSPCNVVYVPHANAVAVYHQMYQLYRSLHDHFGHHCKQLMHTLKEISRNM